MTDNLPEPRALAAWRKRISGWSWIDIADELGYNSAAECSADVSSYRNTRDIILTTQAREQMMDRELAILDTLQQAAWAAASSGNPRSILAVIKIVETRSKLLGLADTTPSQSTTVVIPGDSDSYLHTLRSIGSKPADKDS